MNAVYNHLQSLQEQDATSGLFGHTHIPCPDHHGVNRRDDMVSHLASTQREAEALLMNTYYALRAGK